MTQTMMGTTPEKMMTNRQVAEFLQVSICSVRRWSDKGLLQFYRVGSRGDRRYHHDDVIRFMEGPGDAAQASI